MFVTIDVDPDNEDDVDSAQMLAKQLRDRLLGLDVDSVDYVRGEMEEGAKAGAGELIPGALLVATSPVMIRAAVDVIRAVLRRHEGRRIQLKLGERELTVDGASTADISTVVDAFVRGLDDEES
jgi:hypothetical protein